MSCHQIHDMNPRSVVYQGGVDRRDLPVSEPDLAPGPTPEQRDHPRAFDPPPSALVILGDQHWQGRTRIDQRQGSVGGWPCPELAKASPAPTALRLPPQPASVRDNGHPVWPSRPAPIRMGTIARSP